MCQRENKHSHRKPSTTNRNKARLLPDPNAMQEISTNDESLAVNQLEMPKEIHNAAFPFRAANKAVLNSQKHG